MPPAEDSSAAGPGLLGSFPALTWRGDYRRAGVIPTISDSSVSTQKAADKNRSSPGPSAVWEYFPPTFSYTPFQLSSRNFWQELRHDPY